MVDLTAAFVEHWSGLYREGMGAEEPLLLDTVGPAGRARGYFTREELLRIGRWKSPRATQRLGHNSEADVEEVTRLAFSASPDMRHRILCVLSGVAVPMASAVLTVWDPQQFTVDDRRARQALDALRRSPSGIGYPGYRSHCLKLADQLDVGLRDLDRSLWKWSQHGLPA